MGSKPSRHEDVSHQYSQSANFGLANPKFHTSRISTGDFKHSPLFAQPVNLSTRTSSTNDISDIQPRKKDRLGISCTHRESATNINTPTYRNSSYYKRKIYADSLPRLISRVNLEENVSVNRVKSKVVNREPHALPSLFADDRMVCNNTPKFRTYSMGCRSSSRPNTSCGRLTAACAIDVKPPILVNQQWNDNHWAETDSADSSGLPRVVESRPDNPKNLPQLMSMRLLLNKFETEFGSSSVSLRKGMAALVDPDLLVGRLPSEQKQLIGKAEDGIMNVQYLLASMHQHIAHAHEFCNMLHRIDESLQTFSKAVATVTAWEQKRSDCFQHVQPSGDELSTSTRKAVYRIGNYPA